MMSTGTSQRVLALITTAVALPVALLGAAAQNQATAQNKAIEEFTAFAINTNSPASSDPRRPRPTTAQLTIRIERWSTDEERDQLLAIVRNNSDVTRMNQALLTAMQRLPRVGSIRGTNTVGWDLRFARQSPLDEGGRRVVVATDRPMPFWEVRERPRSFDYPFTIVEMRLDKNNQGEGKLLADTRILIDRRTSDIVLEHYDEQPVRLNQIRRRG